jgi:hypothetical protein
VPHKSSKWGQSLFLIRIPEGYSHVVGAFDAFVSQSVTAHNRPVSATKLYIEVALHCKSAVKNRRRNLHWRAAGRPLRHLGSPSNFARARIISALGRRNHLEFSRNMPLAVELASGLKVVIDASRRPYCVTQPHSSQGYRPPASEAVVWPEVRRWRKIDL